jgi:hypothetical protein
VLRVASCFTSLKERAGSRGGVPVFFRFRSGVRACRRKAGVKVERPAGRTTLTLAFLRRTLAEAGNGIGLGGWRAPCAVRVLRQARGCVHPFGGARGWLPRGHGAGSRAGSGINQTGGRAARGRGPVKPAITRCPRPGLLTRPAARRWPGIGPGRRAWRRRPR